MVTANRGDEPFTYGTYLRVPELTDLQSPLAAPPAPDEMLFIIGQQVQELWFKQILFDLRDVLDDVAAGRLAPAARLLERMNRILRVMSAETEVLELLPPYEFLRFRGILKAASGLESAQFREVELASGLRTDAFLKLASRLVDVQSLLARWPVSLHDALLSILETVDDDPVEALLRILRDEAAFPDLYRLVEALSDYELRFQEWRFHHLQVVERVIGDRSPGTGGSPGGTYLGRTLTYRFFPELWEARNELTGRGGAMPA